MLRLASAIVSLAALIVIIKMLLDANLDTAILSSVIIIAVREIGSVVTGLFKEDK